MNPAGQRRKIHFIAIAAAVAALMIPLAGQQQNAPTSLDRLDQKDLPLDHTFHWTSDGAGVAIYVIDTGVRVTHNDFMLSDAAGHVVGTRAVAFADCSGTGAVKCVTAPADGAAFDCESGYAGHGTHDASLAAGNVYGVAKRANIFAVRAVSNTKVGACQGDNPRAVEAAVRYVIQNARAGPRIINLSFRPQDSGVNAALRDAILAGFTVTVSAGGGLGSAIGNWGRYLVDHAIIAAASDAHDISGCSYGEGLTLYAPAVGMTAAGNRSDTYVYQADQQACVDSFAAPLAAGVAATYLQNHPAATPAEVRTAILNLAAVDKVQRRGGGRDSHLLLQSLPGAASRPVAGVQWCIGSGPLGPRAVCEMPQSTQDAPNPFEPPRHTDTADTERQPARARRLSLPLRMDDGTVRMFDLPSSLDRPSTFSAGEFERLTRAYAEALGLLQPKP